MRLVLGQQGMVKTFEDRERDYNIKMEFRELGH
jgi:hypothetical protein